MDAGRTSGAAARRACFALAPLFVGAAALLVVAELAHGQDADVVRCQMPDGSLYFGASPPEKCVPIGHTRGALPTPLPTRGPRADPQEEE